MKNDTKNINCPHCGKSISIDDALTHQLEEKIKSEINGANKLKEDKISKDKQELEEQKAQFEESKKSAQSEINKKVAEKLATEKILLWKDAQEAAEKQTIAEIKLMEEQMKDKDKKLEQANAESLRARADRQIFEEEKKNFELEKTKQIEDERKKIEEDAFARAIKQGELSSSKLQKKLEDTEKENEQERKLLQEQIEDKDTKLKQANQNELELRKEKQKLKDEKDAFEVEKARQLDEERKKIEEDASKKATDAKQSEIDQLNKKLADATKAKDELARKLEQGSQQTQGEVQELILEELLQSEFIYDDISPVPKGVSGADVIQKVKNSSGLECGTIIWESKNTKNWSEGWIQKLKDDQRVMKADVAVIVTSVLPAGAESISQREGVWVCNMNLTSALAFVLRDSLIALSREKRMSVGKDEKVEILYQYLTGTEFKQRIETIVEAFSGMKSDLDKERVYFEKIWNQREKQIQKVIKNTVGIHGDLSGIVQLQKIESLELPVPKNEKEE